MIILGLHKDPWHNTGAAMIKDDGKTVQFMNMAEERLNREKDSRKFPILSVKRCMEELGVISIHDIDLVVVDYICNSEDWKKDYNGKPCEIDNFLSEIDPKKIVMINHHLAHAYSTFYSSDFDSAAVLIVDGRGSDKETQSLFMATQNGIEKIETTTTIGIGLLYAAITQAIGFGPLQEGKTMGLAPYGSNIKKQIFKFPHVYDGIRTDYSEICQEGSYKLKLKHDSILTFEDKARGAFEVQQECENALLYLSSYAKEKTGSDYLCLSGGVALNSVSNYKILRNGLYKDIFINPAASDTGIPLGCALYGYHKIFGKHKNYKISAYLGAEYSEQRISQAVGVFSGYRIINGRLESLKEAVELLANNKIIGYFQGRSEMGPRALGNRSILMSPLLAENKDILNQRVKHREGFRPFAPVILEEFTQEYFDIDRPCPNMLLVPYIHEHKRKIIPAVTHVDGTGRLQTVNKDTNSRFYEIIEQFYERTGVPVVLNTSFNVAGEPIVETPEDAIRCFLGTNIDALYIGDYLLIKMEE